MDEMEFEKWYQLYPRKEHRIAAIKAWKKLAPSPLTIQKMTADLDRYRGVAWEHIPHPASYINGRRWEDEREGQRIDRDNAYNATGGGGRSALYDLNAAGRQAAEMTSEERQRNIQKFKEIVKSLNVKSVPQP
jgi:hypothetical protein